MTTEYDDTLTPEALIIASQAVLTALLKELAKASPALRQAAMDSLKAADTDLRSLSSEQADPCKKEILIKAAFIAQDMQRAIFASQTGETGRLRQ